MDVVVAFSLLAAFGLVGALYTARVMHTGRAGHARVEAEGDSALVPKGAMEMFYWLVDPIARAFVRAGITANMVTWASLAFGLAAGVAFATGRLGVGAGLALLSAAGDGLDGLIARQTKTQSAAGEVLDATIDRYVELALVAGLAIHLRETLFGLALALLALGGSFMVSYSSAKAEALAVSPPRGSMRRAERAVLLVVGPGLTPIVGSFGATGGWIDAPLLVALAAIGLLSNVSAITRSAAVVATLRRRVESAT